MSSYIHFTHSERICLQEYLREGKTFREIAKILGRSPSSISREVKRNSSKKGYHHWRAQTMAVCRRRDKVYRALRPGTPQWDYIIEKLKLFWPPEAIAGRWSLDNPTQQRISVSTIYRYLRRGELPGVTRRNNLRRRGKKKVNRSANYNSIQPDRIIPDWPEEIRNRARLGDWEGDTVYGGVGKGLLVTLVDRRSRYLCAGLLATRDSSQTREVIEALLEGQPLASVALDNGSEFSEFRTLEDNIGAPVYFAEPHKPWQRGTNENTNGILRFFFPKGYDFHALSQCTLHAVLDLINNRPRKCLGWLSPREFCVALT